MDEDFSFTSHIEFITKKCKQAYNSLTLFPSLYPHLALQLYKSFICSRLEFGSIVWGFKLYQREHLKMRESAQRGVLSLILRTMRSPSIEALEAELSVLPIDNRIEEPQGHESGKLLTKEEEYIKANMEEKSHKQKFESPFCNLRSLAKQLIQHIVQTKKRNMKQIQMPVEIPPTFEIFDIPNLTTILPEPNTQNPPNKEKTLKLYTESIMNLNTENAMIIFTDGSALSNPGLVGVGVVIKSNGPKSTTVKLAKVVEQMGTSYEGEIEAIKLAVKYANENITSAHANLHIYADSQAAILSVTSQDSEKYHNSMI